ncbi:FtsK/SpoIIIE family DNA translocase [Heliobacterium chlorum]|nr:DNA translocase FtsK [Heliobacterium chlorum]
MFEQLKEDLKYEMVGLGILALAVFCIVSLFTVNSSPLTLSSAGAGAVGQFLVNALSITAGQGKIMLPLFLAYFGIMVMTQRAKLIIGRKVVGLTFAFIIVLTFLHLSLSLEGTDWQAGMDGKGGGIIGASMAILFKTLFGVIGTYIILTTLILAAVLFTFEVSLVQLVGTVAAIFFEGFQRSRASLGKLLFTVVEEEEPVPKKAVEKKSRRKKTEEKAPVPEETDEMPLVIIDHEKNTPDWLTQLDLPIPSRSGAPAETIAEDEPLQQREAEREQTSLDDRLPEEAPSFVVLSHDDNPTEFPEEPDSMEDTLVEKISRSPQGVDEAQEQSAAGETSENQVGNGAPHDPSYMVEEYMLPPLSLLNRSLRVKSTRLNQDITENVRILEETLENFNVRVKVTQVSRGPAITRYEVSPAPGVKVSKITNLADDIALSLAAGAVRIEAPIPGKAAIGIEVPNKEVTPVTFREVLECPEFQQSASKLTIALGKDIAGTPIISDLSRMPHMLIAGATGAGKSVCMNTLISSILFKGKPNEVKFLMIDPKMVELTQYNGIPHMIAPVVTDAKKAATALKWIVSEMENRYELFAASGVKDITRYNQLKAQECPDEPQPALPYVVVLIDELADLMMVAAVDVEDAICRLAQMARAAGIHLVVATQRPSVDVITGIIKANIPSRIAFAVSSQIDSRTILDQAGAEKLLGRGDMLFSPVGANKPIRMQGCYVSDKEVENIVEFLKNQGLPEYQEGVIQAQEQTETHEEEEDELFVDAVRILLDSGQASISMLQRRLRVGYARAARLIDIMEQRGIVGGYEGSKPRELLISRAAFEAKYGSAKKTGS